MAESTALIELKKVVDRFIFKYKLPDEDFVNYFEHAADCVRELSIHAISTARQVEIAVSSLGVLTMPGDMLSLVGVALEYKGRLWYFTEEDTMIIRDDADDQMPTDYQSNWASYGVTGAENLFYFRTDWKTRQIHIDGAESQDVILQYLSSGLDLATTTTVPAICTPAIDSYLRLMQGEIDDKPINELYRRKKTYEDEFRLLKLQSLPSLTDIKDYFLSMMTQAIQR